MGNTELRLLDDEGAPPSSNLETADLCMHNELYTLDSFWYRIAYPPHLLSLHFGLMAVVAALTGAALCATGVGLYADCDRLVVTVRWQHGCRRPRGRPPSECILSRRGFLHCACALCLGPSMKLHVDAGVHCIAL